MRAPRQLGDKLVISAVDGTSPKAYPLAPTPQSVSYDTISEQPEAQPNQPVSVPISFHAGLAYDRYDPNVGGALVNTGILTNEPAVLRAPLAVNTVTLTDATRPPIYFWEALAPSATIAFDAVTTKSASSSNSFSWSLTVASQENRILVVDTAAQGTYPDATTITAGGTAMTRIGRVNRGAFVSLATWVLVNPPTGSVTIEVTTSGSLNWLCASRSYYGVHQETPIGTVVGANGAGTNPTVNANSQSGQLVLDAMAANTTSLPTVGAGQTQRYNTASTLRIAGSEEAGAASVTMSWSFTPSVDWVILAVPLQQAPGPRLYVESVEANAVKVHKISLEAGNFGTLLNTKSFTVATTEPQGRPAEWHDGTATQWRLPLGDNDKIRSLTAVAAGTSDDTWSAGDANAARHLRVVKNDLYRTTYENRVSKLGKGQNPESTTFDDDFYVGDKSAEISDIAESGGISSLPKEDGFYDWDGTAEASNVLPDIGRGDFNGQGTIYWHGGFLIPARSGLWWYRTGKPVGPDSNPNNRANDPSLGSAYYFRRGRWMGLATYGEYIYGLYVEATGATGLIVCGYEDQTGWGPITWQVIGQVTANWNHFHGMYIAQKAYYTATETRPCLFMADGNDLAYMWLDKDGSPMTKRGEVDVAASAYAISGRIDFDLPRVNKQLKYISGWAEDMNTGHSWQLAVYRDGGTVENVGAAITADGYFTRYWTQDSNDTCRSLLFRPDWAASSNLTDQNGPHLRDVQIHAVAKPATSKMWSFILAAEDGQARTAKTIRSQIEAYVNVLKKFELPDSDSFNGILTEIRLLRADEVSQLREQNQPPPRYAMLATVREMPTS